MQDCNGQRAERREQTAEQTAEQMKRWGEFSQFPQYSSTIATPTLLVVNGQTSEEFLADITPLFDRADEAVLKKE